MAPSGCTGAVTTYVGDATDSTANKYGVFGQFANGTDGFSTFGGYNFVIDGSGSVIDLGDYSTDTRKVSACTESLKLKGSDSKMDQKRIINVIVADEYNIIMDEKVVATSDEDAAFKVKLHEKLRNNYSDLTSLTILYIHLGYLKN